MTFKDLSPGVHTFVQSHPFECGKNCGLLLTHGMWQRWHDVTLLDYITLYKTPSQQAEAGDSPCGLDVARWLLGWDSSLILTDSKKLGPSVIKPQGNKFCQQPELGSRSFPGWASRWECSPANVLITAMWELSRGARQAVPEILPQETVGE